MNPEICIVVVDDTGPDTSEAAYRNKIGVGLTKEFSWRYSTLFTHRDALEYVSKFRNNIIIYESSEQQAYNAAKYLKNHGANVFVSFYIDEDKDQDEEYIAF